MTHTRAFWCLFTLWERSREQALIASARVLAELRQDVAALRESIDAMRGMDSVRH